MPKVNKKIFIIWSGTTSKQIACSLKEFFEEKVFPGSSLNCFVSELDIESGDDWWKRVKRELQQCDLGIVCITKENVRAPWIHFESGVVIAKDKKLIPVLFNCGFNTLDSTPLSNKHRVDFYNQTAFVKMVIEINKQLGLVSISDRQLMTLIEKELNGFKASLAPVFNVLKATTKYSERYIFPENITTVTRNTAYISAPMSSVDEAEYNELKEILLSEIKPCLEEQGFTKVYCPFNNTSYGSFDGSAKAIKENFEQLKSVEAMIIIYPHARPSSVLVEIGYGLALCKKMVIFHKESLPYILQDARNIRHIDTRQYDKTEEIAKVIKSNGSALFSVSEDN